MLASSTLQLSLTCPFFRARLLAFLIHQCTARGSIAVVSLRTVDSYIVVGDLMQSLTLFRYCFESCSIEEVARDYDSAWVMACESINEQLFICSDTSDNLFTLQRNVGDSSSEEDKARLEHIAKYHIGDQINVFRHGRTPLAGHRHQSQCAFSKPHMRRTCICHSLVYGVRCVCMVRVM